MQRKIGLVLPQMTPSDLRLAKQIGATDIVGNIPEADYSHPLHNNAPVADFVSLLRTKEMVESVGLRWTVIESLRIPDGVKFGEAGRDKDIENWITSIRAIGAAGIPIVCYHWMTGHGHFRTNNSYPVRGGAVSVAYEHAKMVNAPPTEAGIVTEDTLWNSLKYFLEAVVPVAEEAGVKLAMLPDDPPLSPWRGLGRIMRSPENFQRMIDLVPSPNNGITFCQGCFSEMGCHIPTTLKRFTDQDKVFFAHYRNLCGTVESFYETFHDDGDVDMYTVMKAFYDVDFQYPIRPDHVPALEGEDHSRPGHA